jgi:hypothetical protein
VAIGADAGAGLPVGAGAVLGGVPEPPGVVVAAAEVDELAGEELSPVAGSDATG